MGPLFAFLNRLWGSDVKHARTFTLIVTALLSAGLWQAYGPGGALLPWAWASFRCFGYDVFGGSLNPKTSDEATGSMLRFFAPPIPAWFGAAYLLGVNLMLAYFVLCIVALIATLISLIYGRFGDKVSWDMNIPVELAHGAVYGAGMMCILAHAR